MSRFRASPLRRHVIVLSVLAAAGALAAPTGAVAAPPGGGTAACTDIGQLVPVQRDTTVNQGVGAYTTLAPGKQTLVRTYLSMPACADGDDRVIVTSAQLQYVGTSGGAPAFTGIVDAPTPDVPPTGVELPPSGVAPVGGASLSDPIFVLGGDQLPPATFTSGAAFHVTYRVRVTYQASLNGGPLSAPTAVTLGDFSASFAPKQRPVSVLVVPLIDGTVVDPTKRFPPSAVESVVAAMDTLSRQLPVASGVRNDFVETAGIRYAFHPTGLDLRHVGPTTEQPLGKDLMEPDGTYCGANSSLVRRELDKLRMIYNGAVNYTRNAVFDRVLGVVPPTLVSSTCTIAGYADYPGAAAYIAIDPTRSNTGSLATLEIAHTLHLVDPNSPNRNVTTTTNDPSHSKNTEADFADRAFDTHGLTPIAGTSDRSVMRYTTDSAWRDDVTLLEAHEYAYALCRLSPGNLLGTLSCPDPATPGGSAAAAGERFSIVGTTDGTLAGTVADSHTQADGTSDVTDSSSRYRLLAIGPSGVLANYGVPVTSTHSHHGHEHDGTTETTHLSFGISVPSQDATRFELWNGDPQTEPASAVLLYERDRNEAPVVKSTSSTMTVGDTQTVTDPATDDSRPALSPDGTALAWQAGTAMRLRDLTTGGESPSFNGAEAAWSKDGRRLAWTTQTGEVMVGDVDRSTGTPALRDVHPIYYPTAADLTFPASGVSWSPDGESVVSSIAGDLWELPADPDVFLTPLCAAAPVDVCPRLTRTDEVERDPDWSHHGRIAYERGGAVWTLEEDAPDTTQQERIRGAADPTWGHDHLAFSRDGGVWIARVTETAVTDASPLVADATQPAFADDTARLAYASAESPRDVHIASTTLRTTRVEVTDDAPATLRASLVASCPHLEEGLVAFAHPTTRDAAGAGATFELSYDATAACDGAEFRIDVSDGVSVTPAGAGHGGSTHAPVPAISTPLTSAALLQHRPLALVGGVTDRDGDADESGLVWTSEAPNGDVTGATGPTPAAIAAPEGGWQVGEHTITLRATDAQGNVAETTRTFRVVEDRDGDGMSAATESGKCFGADADLDPTNAYDDPDGDGLANVVDDAPCQSLTTVTVDFDPDVLYVPSSGTPVTVTVPKASPNLKSVDAKTVRISRIGAWTVHQPALSFEIDKRGNGIAKFDRQALTAFLAQKGYVGGYVRITVSWSAAGVTYHGVDPNSPVTSPS